MATYKRGSGNYKSSFINVITKKTTTTIDTDDSLNNDTDLKFALRAQTYYHGYLHLRFNSVAAADIDVTFTDITGATADEFHLTSNAVAQNPIAFGTELNIPTDGAVENVIIHFTVKTGSIAADLQFQWAQGTSNGGNTIVYVGSSLVVFEG